MNCCFWKIQDIEDFARVPLFEANRIDSRGNIEDWLKKELLIQEKNSHTSSKINKFLENFKDGRYNKIPSLYQI